MDLSRMLPKPIGRSPSAGRAWIEISTIGTTPQSINSRPPRGGRGLKFHPVVSTMLPKHVALRGEGVD